MQSRESQKKGIASGLDIKLPITRNNGTQWSHMGEICRIASGSLFNCNLLNATDSSRLSVSTYFVYGSRVLRNYTTQGNLYIETTEQAGIRWFYKNQSPQKIWKLINGIFSIKRQSSPKFLISHYNTC